jgi:hypothetical protein
MDTLLGFLYAKLPLVGYCIKKSMDELLEKGKSGGRKVLETITTKAMI